MAAKLYIKYFYTNNGVKEGTRDLEVAKKWLKENKEVCMFYSQAEHLSSTTAITDIVEIYGLIIVKTVDEVYAAHGFDYKFRSILRIKNFYNKTTKEKLYDFESANEAIKHGDEVCAYGVSFQTNPISCFFNNKHLALNGELFIFVII